jgi:hypothetical protein
MDLIDEVSTGLHDEKAANTETGNGNSRWNLKLMKFKVDEI